MINDYINDDVNTNEGGKFKIPAKWKFISELRGLSLLVILLVFAILSGSILLYLFMLKVPDKRVVIDDQMGLFSEQELAVLEEAAEELSNKHNINVAIVATNDKGYKYGNNESGERDYADDYYRETFRSNPLQDNSGFVFLVDLTYTSLGMRYFYIYTYGTAHYTVSNSEVEKIVRNHEDDLVEGRYASAFSGMIDDLDARDYTSPGLIITWVMLLLVPLIVAIVFYLRFFKTKSLDDYPKSETFLNGKLCKSVETKDTFVSMMTTKVKRSPNYSGGNHGGIGNLGGGGFSGGGGSGGGGGISGGGGINF